jgi:micrococcal nuclease
MKRVLILLLLSTGLLAETITGKVVKVADGDTVTILDNTGHSKKEIRVRLLAIDAPESKQAYGKKSKAYLSQLVFNKTVTVQWTKKDRYKRVLGVLFINGKNINQEMLKSGLAWHYRQYSKDKSLQEMEDKAKANKLGLWQDPKAIAPWDFRRKK